MNNYLSEDGTFINSLIGEGSHFSGDLNIKGLLRIDGDFKGTINDGGKVLIGKSGRAEASISAGTVVVGGVLKGNILATEKVVILSTGMLIGNVTSPRLLVEDGVIIDGKCTIMEEKAAPAERAGRFSLPFRTTFGKEREMETVTPWKK